MEAAVRSDGYCGPDDLAQRVVDDRAGSEDESEAFGVMGDDGVREIIRVAYHASQAANEGRYPRFTILVPSLRAKMNWLLPLRGRLDVDLLRRIGPVLASPDHALLVKAGDGGIEAWWLVSTVTALGQLNWGATIGPPCRGLSVEVSGPGDLRATELKVHRLAAGRLLQERSFTLDRWFVGWLDEAALTLFGRARPDGVVDPHPQHPLAAVWLRLLKSVERLRHGGCFAVVPSPPDAAIRPGFHTPGCDLGRLLAHYHLNVHVKSTDALDPERLRSRERILAVMNAITHLSTTDGCLVFDRQLSLHSFGSMIEVDRQFSSVPCFEGDTTTPLSAEKMTAYGARRRSAVQLCQACPGAMAFVISQDGDLRIFIRDGDVVRLYDHAAYW
jgi:hypothetical protein